MLNKVKIYITVLAIPMIVAFSLQGCAGMQGASGVPGKDTTTVIYKFERSVVGFEDQGKKWGEKHWKEKRKPAEVAIGQGDKFNIKRITAVAGVESEPVKNAVADSVDVKKTTKSNNRQCDQMYDNIDVAFVEELKDKSSINYFWSNTDWKEAFKKGYKQGFKDRTADLVLGPHLSVAAACIGDETGMKLTDVIESFSNDWQGTLTEAINTFITLISEGSQSDREAFILSFSNNYIEKYKEESKKADSSIIKRSEGGTLLYLDPKTLGVLQLSTPDSLKTAIYHQIFQVMGDEWGRKYKDGLIKRDELIALLRASKTALMEVDPQLKGNLDIVQKYFCKRYGIDGENVFKSLVKDSGLMY